MAPPPCHLKRPHEEVTPAHVNRLVVSAALVVLSLVDGLAVPAAPRNTPTTVVSMANYLPPQKGRPFAMTSILRWSVTGTTLFKSRSNCHKSACFPRDASHANFCWGPSWFQQADP